MNSGRSNLIEIACEIRVETARAWLIYDGSREVWIPKSQAEKVDGGLEMPEWLALDKNLL